MRTNMQNSGSSICMMVPSRPQKPISRMLLMANIMSRLLGIRSSLRLPVKKASRKSLLSSTLSVQLNPAMKLVIKNFFASLVLPKSSSRKMSSSCGNAQSADISLLVLSRLSARSAAIRIPSSQKLLTMAGNRKKHN